MVGAADTVKARLLQQSALPVLCGFKGSCTNDAIVMMDTGASQFYLLAVDSQTVEGIDFQLTNTEGLPNLVQKLLTSVQRQMTLIQRRIVAIP